MQPVIHRAMSTMSSEGHVEENFKLVTYKRGKRGAKHAISIKTHTTDSSDADSQNQQANIRRIQEAKTELKSSDLFASTVASLREGTVTLRSPSINEIVCFGLGNIDLYRAEVKVYDPVFSRVDRWLLEFFECDIFEENCEGKYRVNDKSTTIFYMPHCPKQLTNNVLWANWGLNLHHCIIVANSFHTIVDYTPRRLLNSSFEYIVNIFPYILELAVINSFKYRDIFNDTAIHIFPWDKIKLLSDDFWSFNSEPVYSDDAEFIQNEIDPTT